MPDWDAQFAAPAGMRRRLKQSRRNMKETIPCSARSGKPRARARKDTGRPHREHGRSVEGRPPWPVTLLLGEPAIERAAVKVRPKFGIQRGRVKP
jgi:hypothetical protein